MTETNKLIAKGKVANIVATSQIALNVGSASGVKKGDTVTLRREVKVVDPDTKKDLGSVFFVRLTLKVNYVDKSLCVAIVEDRVPTSASASALASLGQVAKLKSVTLDESDESPGTVLVHIGEEAVVRRIEEAGDES